MTMSKIEIPPLEGIHLENVVETTAAPTKAQEKKLIRKLDQHVVPLVSFCCQLFSFPSPRPL